MTKFIQTIRGRASVIWSIVLGVVIVGVGAFLLYRLFSGSGEEIETAYGRCSGGYVATSVNGTAVLAGIFKNAGHTVRTKRMLTDALMKDCDVIVWAPDSLEAPPTKVKLWFDQWFAHDNRLLIYIGRDFDAAPRYYDTVIPGAPPDQVGELRRRRTQASSDHRVARKAVVGVQDCEWFTLNLQPLPRKIDSLDGPWREGIDASKAEIELHGRLKPKRFDSEYDELYYGDIDVFQMDEDYWYSDEDSADEYTSDELADEFEDDAEEAVEDDAGEDTEEDAEDVADLAERIIAQATAEGKYLATDSADVLLSSGDDILISRVTVGNTSSEILLVANGSFLLNLPLVNHEHRKIAAQLVGEVETPRTVVFLESGDGGPKVVNKEPAQDFPTGLALFSKRPIDVILFHMAILGVIFCMARWPIFGRPRRPDRDSVSDFGMHVEALGEILEKTGDRHFAQTRLQEYQLGQRTESSTLVASG